MLTTGATPVVSPVILEITGETILGDGSRQQAYKWTNLVSHTATTGHRAFGASILTGGQILVTGGTDGTDGEGAADNHWNLFTYTRSPVQDVPQCLL